jgi:hypothetical protein
MRTKNIMSESKTYVFGNEGAAGGNLLASIIPALQNKGIDSSYLMGLMSGNNNGGGFFGNNGGFQDIIALIVIAAIFGNGNFGFGNNGNNQNSQLLASLLERNGVDIASLASSVNCSSDRIRDAIGQVSTQICNLAGQNAMSFQQVINSIQAGNSALATQLAQCCCDLKGIMSEGFSSVGYALRDQTCNLEKAIAASTAQILDGQRAAEMREMQNKIDALREKNSQQAVILNNAQQTAQFSAMLAPIAEDLASIKCKLPKTEVVSVQPEYIPINRSVNVPYGPYCGGFGGFGFGNFSGWNGNNCGNSLWG